MGIVVVGATMSLDGFIAGPGDAMDWIFEYALGPEHGNPLDLSIIKSTGAVLTGRRCYDVGRRAERPETSGLYGGLWQGPEFVLTHAPPDDEDRPSITFLSGDIRGAVATALSAAGGLDLLVLGADVIGQCLDAGLVDEIRLHVAPVLLGDGVRLFRRPAGPNIQLETLLVLPAGPVTDMYFRVTK